MDLSLLINVWKTTHKIARLFLSMYDVYESKV